MNLTVNNSRIANFARRQFMKKNNTFRTSEGYGIFMHADGTIAFADPETGKLINIED